MHNIWYTAKRHTPVCLGNIKSLGQCIVSRPKRCRFFSKKHAAVVFVILLVMIVILRDRIVLHFDSDFYSIRINMTKDLLFNTQDTAVHNQNTPPLLTLFTTFKDVPLQRLINENTIKSWTSLKGVVPVMFYVQGDSPYLIELAKTYGWQVFEAPRLRSKIPVLKEMFQHVINNVNPPTPFTAFANADILFGEKSLYSTLELLARMNTSHLEKHGLFVTGRRRPKLYSSVDTDKTIALESDLFENSSKAQFDVTYALDYFIYLSSKFPYVDIPDFVVGKVGFDNWMATHALNQGMVTIDASYTILAVHQVQTLAPKEDGWLSKNACLNRDLVDPFNYQRGQTICCKYFTQPSTFPAGNKDGDRGLEVYWRYKVAPPCDRPLIKELFKLSGSHKTCQEMRNEKKALNDLQQS